MKKSKINGNSMARITALFLAMTLLCGMALSLIGCSSDKNYESQTNYLRVSADGEKLEMKVTITETGLEKVSLFALDIWQSTSDIANMTPIAECKVKDNVVSLKHKLEGDLTEALCKGYVLAKLENSGYKPVSGMYYVSNPRDIHKKSEKDENVPLTNIKGAIGSASQLIDLGASSTVVTVNVGKLIAPAGGIGTIPYTWSGYTCYVNRTEVEKLDREIKSYSDAGIYVFLELVQTYSYDELSEGTKSIAFTSAENAEGYALNMTDRDGAVKICGLFDFLAGRYANGGENGSAKAFIIGRTVNNYTKHYAGADSAKASAQNYMAAVRAAYTVLTSHTPEGRVYVSVDNNWNVSNDNAREFLSTIAGMADDGGDFYWQVAIEANASDATLSSIWNDDLTGEQPNFISPANIEVLSSLLSTGQFTCNGMRRNILLNRFAVGGSNEDARAASYAYAYYKCLDTKNVDGLIYAKVVDSPSDVLKNGLLSAESDGKLAQKKVIGTVFSSIDNADDGQTNSLGSTVGSVWDKLYGDNRKNATKRDVIRSGFSSSHSGDSATVLTTFSNGDTFGFTPVASAEYAELRYSSQWERPTLYVDFMTESSSEGAGVTTSSLKTKDLKGIGFIGISALAMTEGSSEVDITVRLSGYKKNGVEKVLVCMGRYTSNNWVDLYCDVKDFLKDIKSDEIKLTVLASASDGNGTAENLWLAQVMTEAPVNNGLPTWLLITIIVAAVLIVGGTVFVIWFKKNFTFVREDEDDEEDPQKRTSFSENNKRNSRQAGKTKKKPNRK